MFVSVIIPNYNHAPFLKQRIDSVLNQTFQEFELIILDDCSTDGSKAIIEQYRNHPKVSHIQFNEENSGSPFHQWERGIGLAKGNYVWIAESDDYAELNFLEVLTSKFVTDNVGLAYSQSWDVDDDGKRGTSRLYWTDNFSPNIWKNDFTLTGSQLLPFLRDKCIIPNVSACIFKKEILSHALLIHPLVSQFSMCGDWYLYLTLFKNENFYMAFSSDVLSNFRETKQSTRYFQNIAKKQTRVLEELRIVKANQELFKPDEYHKRIQLLKSKWFAYHNKSNFNSRFFAFGRNVGINSVQFFFDFIKYKLVDRKRPGLATAQ